MARSITPEALAASGTEHGHQAALFCWANNNVKRIPSLRWLHAIPNGGLRHPATAARLAAEGAKRGIPDIFWPVSCGGFHGLYIEMKVGKNQPTQEQREFMDHASVHSYAVAVCYSWLDAVQVIEDYWQLPYK